MRRTHPVAHVRALVVGVADGIGRHGAILPDRGGRVFGMARTLRSLLTDDLLDRIHERAAGHDRDNTFPHDDLADLVAAGYLTAFVPERLGGAGLSLEEVAREQVRLAAAAPATALAVNMHLVVTGLAALLVARGDDSVEFILTDAAAGEIFAFGNSEAGNDLVMFGSRTRAERQDDGGYRYFGTKIFTSLSPVWTRLATFGLDESDLQNPRLVHGVVSRDEGGIETRDDWDTLGMRATQSATTVLDGALAPAGRVYRAAAAGAERRPVHLRAVRRVRGPARRRVHGHRPSGDRARRGGGPAHGRR